MPSPYDLIAEQWHATANDRGHEYVARVLAYVDRVLEGLPPGAKVLDLGCGTGQPIASYIARRGYRVIGVDQSREMLRFARQVIPEAEFIQADMVSVEFNQSFDAAIAWDSMFHVQRNHHAAIYRNVASCLETGARVLFSVGGSDSETDDPEKPGEGFTSEMFGHSFFYSGWPVSVARKLIEAADLEIELWEVDDPTSRGHIAVIARKA